VRGAEDHGPDKVVEADKNRKSLSLEANFAFYLHPFTNKVNRKENAQQGLGVSR